MSKLYTNGQKVKNINNINKWLTVKDVLVFNVGILNLLTTFA
jgi:hypothetical protein